MYTNTLESHDARINICEWCRGSDDYTSAERGGKTWRWPFSPTTILSFNFLRQLLLQKFPQWIIPRSIFTHVNFFISLRISPLVPLKLTFSSVLSFFSFASSPNKTRQTNESERDEKEKKIQKAAINHNFLTISSFYNFLRWANFFPSKKFFLRRLASNGFLLKAREEEGEEAHGEPSLVPNRGDH